MISFLSLSVSVCSLIVTTTSSTSSSLPSTTLSSLSINETETIDEEKCPDDSILIDGICECNYEQCIKPICDKHLNVIANSTDVPGDCCPTYSCDDCLLDEQIDGKCEVICENDTFLNERGKCECIDSHKSLINNECVCDKNLCELPNLCDEYAVPVKYTDGCCENYNCIKCPKDSHSYPLHDYTNTEIESKCVCNECPEVFCEEGIVLNVIKRGNGFPSTCCDQYECLPSCNINGTRYQHGENWTDNGDICECKRGISFCRELKTYESCEDDDGTIYPHEGYWDVDNCTFCKCINGEKKCISHMCETNISFSPHPECPTIKDCTLRCDIGFEIKHGCEICKCKLNDKTDLNVEQTTIINDYNNYNEEFDFDLVNNTKRKDNITRFMTNSSTTTTTTRTTTTTTMMTMTTATTTLETTTNATLTTTNHPNEITKPESSMSLYSKYLKSLMFILK